MSYHYSRIINQPFDEAVQATSEALKRHGFGILSEIDVQATLKQKLDVEFRPYRILGACNPKFAHQALQAEDKIGTMLPCNVIIQQRDDQSVEVSAVDPVASMQAVDNSALSDIAKQIQGMLRRIVDEVGTPAA